MSIYITITGQKHYYGLLPFSVGSVFTLRPDPDNLYDNTAIAVYSSIYGKVGYVAQSPDMGADGTAPAASLLPLLHDERNAQVCFIAGDYIIAKIC